MATASEVIIEVMREVQGVAKRDKNSAQGFNFRGIDAVVNAIGPALRKHGAFIVPTVVDEHREQVTSAKGSQLNVARVQVMYSIYAVEGDPISGVVAAEAFDSGDKATAKAMSVAYRTFMLQTFCLPTDEPDPDSFSYDTGAVKKVVKAVPKDLVELLAGADVAGLQALYEQARADGWWSDDVAKAFSERKAAIK